ncbi:hypothetical protein QE152_g19181 [Popillia japonica]|uniref:Uncharacterized protein n=1 Tax=Popillia japonica TaxID=7064 RepID=A0AAW1L465_POPJA
MTVVSADDSENAQTKNKRSPLEHGHVEFGIPFLKATHNVPAIIDHVKTDLKPVKKVVSIKEPHHAHFRDEWIPGHVHDHSFIPGHFQHILLPSHTIYLDDAVVVSHDYDLPYRHHYGGFGVGLDTGGHGSGHGFHIWHAYSI